MTILLGVILLFAVLSLGVLLVQARAIVAAAPANAGLSGTFWLRWWKFGDIAAKAGPAAAEPLAIYKRAAIAFVFFIILGLILSGFAANS